MYGKDVKKVRYAEKVLASVVLTLKDFRESAIKKAIVLIEESASGFTEQGKKETRVAKKGRKGSLVFYA